MLKFIVKNIRSAYSFTIKNSSLLQLFIINNRTLTDTLFLTDENDLLLLDESGKALVD